MSGRWWSIHGSRGWWFDVKEELEYRRMVEAVGWNPSHMVVARSFWQRFRGLLGWASQATVLWVPSCFRIAHRSTPSECADGSTSCFSTPIAAYCCAVKT